MIRAFALISGLMILGCATDHNQSLHVPPARVKSAEELRQFVQTGDTSNLRGLFTDSLQVELSTEHILGVRSDLIGQYGEIGKISDVSFDSAGNAHMVVNFEKKELEALLLFAESDKIGLIEFKDLVACDSLPAEQNVQSVQGSSQLKDLNSMGAMAEAFDVDVGLVRLVALLSPT